MAQNHDDSLYQLAGGHVMAGSRYEELIYETHEGQAIYRRALDEPKVAAMLERYLDETVDMGSQARARKWESEVLHVLYPVMMRLDEEPVHQLADGHTMAGNRYDELIYRTHEGQAIYRRALDEPKVAAMLERYLDETAGMEPLERARKWQTEVLEELYPVMKRG